VQNLVDHNDVEFEFEEGEANVEDENEEHPKYSSQNDYTSKSGSL
jgi:hypothetical protein